MILRASCPFAGDGRVEPGHDGHKTAEPPRSSCAGLIGASTQRAGPRQGPRAIARPRSLGVPRMAIGPRLDLRQSQALVMTPQLRQAIKLLQFSNMEVTAFIEEELERNPLLERDERPETAAVETPAPDQAPERNSGENVADV